MDLWADVVDTSIEDPSLLPATEVIVEQLTSALGEFKLLAAVLAAPSDPHVNGDDPAALADGTS